MRARMRNLPIDILSDVLYKQYMTNEQTHGLLLNLPKPLHRQLKRRAERNLRSVHSEIVLAIQNHLLGAAPADTAQPPAPVAQTQEA
jgi:hypothetical protein